MRIRPLPLVLATLLVITTFPYSATAEVPLADAGLDQTVTKGTTVQLDATGSRDTDGTIESYQWEILDPEGDPASPECITCGQTTFTADVVGTYEVTVTVTDDDGEAASDTLYVVVKPGESPSIVLTGPSTLQTGQTGTYVAESDAGDAALEEIVWLVDGTPVDVHPVSGDTAIATLDQQFPTGTTHHITARVVDTDGQTALQTVATSVFEPSTSAGGETPWPGTGATGSRGTAMVSGPQLITGERPLRGTYSLKGSFIDSVTWWKDGMNVGTGRSFTTAFTPGEHRLHAEVTYTDGSTGIGRFDEGTTQVVADPKPVIELDELDGAGGLNVESTATDGYGNLQRFEVRLDGETVLSRETNRFDLRKADEGRTLELSSQGVAVDPGTYDAVLAATDGRGQEARIYDQIEVVGPPEVVRSEFVNTDDLDVHHPRIDPERYTAKHVIEIDLNGANEEELTINHHSADGLIRIDNSECTPNRRQRNGVLLITSCWASSTLHPVDLISEFKWTAKNPYYYVSSDTHNATPSNPVIDIRVISGGAGENAKRWGLWIDAGASFDPDGTSLEYYWSGGAVSTNARGNIGKLDSFRLSGLMIKDKNGGQSTLRESFLSYFNPQIQQVKQVSTGPFLPGDEVIFIVTSEPYELPKNNYREHINIKLESSNGEVIDRADYHGEFAGDVHDRYASVANENAGNFEQIFWTVRVPAEAFLGERPTVETYHVENREETLERAQFPRPEVLESGEPYAKDTEIETEFVVNRPIYSLKSTVFPSVLEAHEDNGYQVIRSQPTGREWTFERRELVAEAVYDTDSETFDTRGERAIFLELNPEWQPNGSELATNEVTLTKYQWRDSKEGPGTYTGDTRRQKVQSAKYKTERKYRYEYITTESRTRTRTKTYTYDTSVEYEDTVEECNRYIGCYEKTVTRTKSVTRTETIEYDVTYDVEVSKTSTYWSAGKRGSSHTYTGTSRSVLLHPAEYRTQYEFAYEETSTTRSRKYKASVTELVEPAKYEWQFYKATRSPLYAQELEASADVRRRGVSPVTEWTLRKQTGSEFRAYSNYQNRSEVVKTKVEISGTVVTPYKDSRTGEIVTRHENQSALQYTITGYEDKNTIIERYISDWVRGNKQ